MERSSYSDYRTQLLQKALQEKKKLGLDGSHASSVKHSSALKALQCYGAESSDAALCGEAETEALPRTHARERRKTIDLPKQTTATVQSTQQQSLTPNSFSSGNMKDSKQLKSILKKDTKAAVNKHSPYNSNINTPFFLNNAENEDEFLYGKGIKEQSLRASALYASTKRDSKTPTNYSKSNSKDKNTADLLAQNSKTSSCLTGDSTNNLSFKGYKTNLSANSKSKSSAVSSNVQNPKMSSNLSGYLALLSFTKTERANVSSKIKNISPSGSSPKKCESSRENSTNTPAAHNNLTSGGFHEPNSFKSPAPSSVVAKRSEKSLDSVSKQSLNFVPYSVQKLHAKKTVDHSGDRKSSSLETVTEKALEKSVLRDSSRNDFSKSSEVEKVDVKPKPKMANSCLKKDELLLLNYSSRNRNIYKGETKSDQYTKQLRENNSDSKSVTEKSSNLDEKTNCNPIVVPVACSAKNTKPVANSISAVETTGDSAELKNKSDFNSESEQGAIKPKPPIHAEILLNSKERPVSNACRKETEFPCRKEEFLKKLSSIKQKKKNFFNQGKNSFRKDLLFKQSLKRPRSVFIRGKVCNQISKGGSYSRAKQSYDFKSEKTVCRERAVGDMGEKYSLSPKSNNACDRSFHSYSFNLEKDMADHNSRDYIKESSPVFMKSDDVLSCDNNLTSFSTKNVRKYDDLSPERLSDVDVTDSTKQGRPANMSAVSSKKHSFYNSYGRDTFDREPQRRSLDWSPSRNDFDYDVSTCFLESPTFDPSPKRRQHLERSPSRLSLKENYGIYPSDKSLSPISHSFNGPSPASDSYDASPRAHSHMWSPDSHFHRRAQDSHSYDRSPIHDSYSRSPDRNSYNRSPDRNSYNRSPGRNSYSRSPGRNSYNRSPDHNSYNRSPDRNSYNRSPDRNSYNRSPDRNSYNRSPVPPSCGGSSGRGSSTRNSSPHYYDGNHDSRSRNRSSRHHSYDGSPRSESCDQNLGTYSQERKYVFHKGHKPCTSENSPPRYSVEKSSRRKFSRERSPERISVNASERKLSQDRSSWKYRGDESRGMHLSKLNQRNLSSERELRNDSYGVSPQRFQKSRSDSYHDSPDKLDCKSSLKGSREGLKHPYNRSREMGIFDSSKRHNDRTIESECGDLNQDLSLGVPVKHQHLEEHSKSLVKHTPTSLHGISQHEQQQSVLDKNFTIPDVNRIVNAIDSLASNYLKMLANNKTHSITQGHSSQSYDSTLNVQDPVQLNAASASCAAAYDASWYNHGNNNSQFLYNSEVPNASYPPYNVSSVGSYVPNYVPPSLPLPPLHTASTSPFCGTTAAASSYSSTAGTPFSSMRGQDTNAASSTFSSVNTESSHNPVQEPCNVTNELSELYPADELSCRVSGDSRRRVATLTAVPVQPDEVSKKNSNTPQSSITSAAAMKFITPDKIEKLLRQKSEIRKQIGRLNDEYEKLLKMQGDALRTKRREKDGHKDLLTLEYGKLQDEIKSLINNLIGDMKKIEQELKNGFLGCTSDEENGKEQKKAEEYYEFYDSGSHWCRYCNKMCTTVVGMLEHMKSDGHLEFISQIEKPYYSSSASEKPTTDEQKGQEIATPIKGLQFIMPVEGFYCSLCKEYFEKISHVQMHLESLKHFETYQNYTVENPTYECQWLVEKIEALPQIEIEDKKVTSMDDKLLQKKQTKEGEELKCKKQEEGAGSREIEEKERFGLVREQQFKQQEEEPMQTVEDRTDLNTVLKKKQSTVEKDQIKEGSYELKVGMVDKLNYGKKEKQNSDDSKERKKERKYLGNVEEQLLSYRKLDHTSLKRKKDEGSEPNNKVRILSSTHETKQNSGKVKNTNSTVNQHVEKQPEPEPKWTVCSQLKKLPVNKGKESKSKSKQTVVYIGRAPNFKSYSKGNSSFRENLLKLALQKKEDSVNPDSVVNSPVAKPTLLKTVKQSHSTEDGLSGSVGNDSASGFPSSSGLSVFNTPGGNNTRPANKIGRRLPSSSQNATQSGSSQGTSEISAANITHDGASVYKGVRYSSNTDPTLSQNQLVANVSLPVPQPLSYTTASIGEKLDATGGSTSGHSASKTYSRALWEQTKRRHPVQGPLTEEDDDYRLLGINREDRLPLVLPKPPPAALIWSCPKGDTHVTNK